MTCLCAAEVHEKFGIKAATRFFLTREVRRQDNPKEQSGRKAELTNVS